MKSRLSLTQKIGIACLCACLFLFPYPQRFLRAVGSVLLYPVLVSARYLTTTYQRIVEHKKTYTQLHQAHKALKMQHRALQSEVAQLRARLYEQQITQEIRAFEQKHAIKNGVRAHILLRRFDVNNHYYLVDKGSRDGIVVDMVALFAHHLLGKVTQVFPWYCKVQLITDAQSCVAVTTHIGHIQGIAQGVNAPELKMNFVSRVHPVRINDAIFTTGQGLVFPLGLQIGTVKTVEKQEFYHDITLKPGIDLSKIMSCLLVKRENVQLY